MFGQKAEKQADIEIFTVFDSKSRSYDDPIFAPNKDVLLRDILNIFRDPQKQETNKFFINAEDYSLFRVGSYSKRTGELDHQKPEHIVNFHELRALVTPEVHRSGQETGPRAL